VSTPPVNEPTLPAPRTHTWVAAGTTAAAAVALFAACTSAPSRAADNGPAQVETTAAADSLRAMADRSRVEGSAEARLWLIIASDFQCPYCAQWHRESHDSIRVKFIQTGRVRAAYVNFPLDQHRHARVAASAALCAGAQQRFWPVHDAIFATQQRWSDLTDATGVFDSLAAAQGVEMGGWRSCMSQGVMDPVVRADRERATSTGVQSTPTFLLLPATSPAEPGQMIRGAVPLPELSRVLDSMLTAAGGAEGS
jgi:protein-disulfide isomerase